MGHASKTSQKALSAWTVRHDQICLLRATGTSERELAKTFNLARSTISNIVNDPRGQKIIELTRQKLRERIVEDVESQLDLATKASIKVLRRTLEADISPIHQAKANQDRVALKMLQGRGFLRTEQPGQGGGFQMAPEQFDRLVSAMAKADAAQGIDPFSSLGEGVEEADFEVVEDDGDRLSEALPPRHKKKTQETVVENDEPSRELRPDAIVTRPEPSAPNPPASLREEAKKAVEDWLKERVG